MPFTIIKLYYWIESLLHMFNYKTIDFVNPFEYFTTLHSIKFVFYDSKSYT